MTRELNIGKLLLTNFLICLLDDTEDIPTFMLRLTNIEYKRSTVLDPDTRPISDWQVILDGKTLDIGELSMHLLHSYHINPTANTSSDKLKSQP